MTFIYTLKFLIYIDISSPLLEIEKAPSKGSVLTVLIWLSPLVTLLALLPLFQQLDDGILHLLGGV